MQIKVGIAEQIGESVNDVNLDEVSPDVLEKVEKEVAHEHGLSLPGLHSLTVDITNVTSKSFGIVVVLDQATDTMGVSNLIMASDQVPLTISNEFYTSGDNQTGVVLRCVENTETVGPDDPSFALDTSTEIGVTELDFGQPLPKRSPIKVTFSLAEDGLLSVHGNDLTTNREIDAQYKTDSILSSDELQKAKEKNMGISVS